MQMGFNGDRGRTLVATALALAMLGLFAGFAHRQGTREVFEYPYR